MVIIYEQLIRRTICLVFALASFLSWSSAQTRPLNELEVDLGSGVFTSTVGLPFDVPFIIKGDVTENLTAVYLRYKIKDKYKKWMTFPREDNHFSDTIKWELVDTKLPNQKFRLLCGAIHPNVTYEFAFTIYRSFNFQTKQDEFKRGAYSIVAGALQDMSKISIDVINAANKKLNENMNMLVPPGATVVDKKKKPFDINFFEEGQLKTMSNRIISLNAEIREKDSLIKRPEDVIKHPNYKVISSKLSDLLNYKKTDSTTVNLFINTAVDNTNTKFKNYTLKDIIKFFIPSAPIVYKIGDGTMTLDGKNLISASAPDLEAINLIIIFLERLKQIESEGVDFSVAPALTYIDDLRLAFIEAKNAHIFDTSVKEKKDQLLAEFPDILSDKLLSFTYIVSDQSNIDVVNEKTPYIGLDFGFAYTFGYNLFLYEGVNFYLSPVNKDAPLTSFNWRNRFLKSFSIHFGITQNLVKVEKDLYEPLIPNIGSVLAGAGYRFNRIMRGNLGWMFFYEQDANPLLDKKHLSIMPTASLTFDLNIAKALGAIGNIIVPPTK
jgi:hypothetical protein